MTGQQSVVRCTAWRNLAGLGAIGRVVVAVRFENGTQSVSRGVCWQGLGYCSSSIHKDTIFSFNLWCKFGWLTCQLRHSTAYRYPCSTSHCRRWRYFLIFMHMSPLRRRRRERNQCWMFLKELLSTDVGFVTSLQANTIHFPPALHGGLVLKDWLSTTVFENPGSSDVLIRISCCVGSRVPFTCSSLDSRSRWSPTAQTGGLW